MSLRECDGRILNFATIHAKKLDGKARNPKKSAEAEDYRIILIINRQYGIMDTEKETAEPERGIGHVGQDRDS